MKKAQREKKDQNKEKGTFLTQSASATVKTIKLFDENQMNDGSEYDSYITIATIEKGLKDNDHGDQVTHGSHRQVGTPRVRATELSPVKFKTFVQAGDLPHFPRHNKGEDTSSVHTMLKCTNAQCTRESDLLVLEENTDTAILDTGCARSASGKDWIKAHIDNLSQKDRLDIKRKEGKSYFRFGNGKNYKSEELIILPVYFGEHIAMMAVDVVEVKIPLLISLLL